MPFLAPLIPLAVGAVAKSVAGSGGGGGSGGAPPSSSANDPNSPNYQYGGYGGSDGYVTNDPFAAIHGGDTTAHAVHYNSGAEDAQQRYQGMGQAAANQAAPGTDYSTANDARGGQADALGMMQQAAMGNAPSQAAIMMSRGNDQAMANTMSLAAGARGAGAMAGAQQQAMGVNSNMATQNIGNMGALRAQEMANARGAYMGGATGIRGQDQSQAQYDSGLAMQQRQLGAQQQMGYEGMGQGVAQAQLGASMGRSGAAQAAWDAQQQRNNVSQSNTNQNIGTFTNAGVSLVKGAAAG